LTTFAVHPLDPTVQAFLAERHLGVLTTLRADGSPHAVPVGFAYDPDDHRVRIITQTTSVKARNAARSGRATVTQVDGRRWLTLEGAVDAYTRRYHAPRPGREATRGAIEILVDRILGRV
jgi:PPOX class probable F420-dependent enzyme